MANTAREELTETLFGFWRLTMTNAKVINKINRKSKYQRNLKFEFIAILHLLKALGHMDKSSLII